jgi:hypothetical protein
MAQSRVIELSDCGFNAVTCDCMFHENMRAAEATHSLTHDGIFEALDGWLGDSAKAREFKVRPILLGRICTLYEGGDAIATERGRWTDEAIENALRTAGAL